MDFNLHKLWVWEDINTLRRTSHVRETVCKPEGRVTAASCRKSSLESIGSRVCNVELRAPQFQCSQPPKNAQQSFDHELATACCPGGVSILQAF